MMPFARGSFLRSVDWRTSIVVAPLAWHGYNYAAQCYAQIMLGAACTEQLWMQKLQGTVELELCIKPFSRIGELRGMLSPVLEKPHVSGPINHRAFTLIESPNFADREGLSQRTKARHAERNRDQLPPVIMRRDIPVWPPLPNVLELLYGESHQEIQLFCRKTRAQTEYFFGSAPQGFSVPGF